MTVRAGTVARGSRSNTHTCASQVQFEVPRKNPCNYGRNGFVEFRSSVVRASAHLPGKLVMRITHRGVDTVHGVCYLLPLAPSVFYPHWGRGKRQCTLKDLPQRPVDRMWTILLTTLWMGMLGARSGWVHAGSCGFISEWVRGWFSLGAGDSAGGRGQRISVRGERFAHGVS